MQALFGLSSVYKGIDGLSKRARSDGEDIDWDYYTNFYLELINHDPSKDRMSSPEVEAGPHHAEMVRITRKLSKDQEFLGRVLNATSRDAIQGWKMIRKFPQH